MFIIIFLVFFFLGSVFHATKKKKKPAQSRSAPQQIIIPPPPPTRQTASVVSLTEVRRQQREAERTRSEAEKARLAEQKRQQREAQATADIDYYKTAWRDQIELAAIAEAEVQRAKMALDIDVWQAKQGSPVTERIATKHAKAYREALKRKMAIEKQGHTIARNMSNARYRLNA